MISAAPGENIYEEAKNLQAEKSFKSLEKSDDRSEERKVNAPGVYQNVAENDEGRQEATHAARNDRMIHKTVIQVDAARSSHQTLASDKGGKKMLAPSPPSSPHKSDLGGGNQSSFSKHISEDNTPKYHLPSNSGGVSPVTSNPSSPAKLSRCEPASSAGISKSSSLPTSAATAAEQSCESNRKSFVLPQDLVTRL